MMWEQPAHPAYIDPEKRLLSPYLLGPYVDEGQPLARQGLAALLMVHPQTKTIAAQILSLRQARFLGN